MMVQTVLACTTLILTSCGGADGTGREEAPKDSIVVQSEPKPQADSLLDRLGRLLAGTFTDTTDGSGATDSSRNRNANSTDKFTRLESERLLPMRSWNSANMNDNGVPPTRFLFYPFSGGDFIHAYTLFPEAQEYLLVAREPVGHIPDLFKEDSAYVRAYLQDIDYMLRDIYQKSFFITLNMQNDLRSGRKLSGIAPLILWTVSHLGFDISAIRYHVFDSNGVKTRVENPDGIREGLVEIDFFKKGDAKVRTVSYLSCDLTDKGLSAFPGYERFVRSKLPADVNCFVKSASYLMHGSDFTRIREIILSHSAFLVQDDTGIPYRMIPKERYRFRLFGEYQTPIPPFGKGNYQSDLAKAYTDSAQYAGPLAFSLGYHWWGSRKQNQMVAIRK